MRMIAEAAAFAGLVIATPAFAQQERATDASALANAAIEAQQALRQTFSNLQFEDFGPAPVKGPLYQANAGGRMIYFAPESGHLLFAAIYDRNGVNVTALAQDATARKRLGAIDTSQALAIGPSGGRQVIEFTDPDCPYCQALERYWATKAGEGKQVRRLVYFVSGIHPQAAAKAEHILCSPDPEAAFKFIYAGATPKVLLKCAEGSRKVVAQGDIVRKLGITGTPTLFLEGKMISGFQQAEIEAFLNEPKGSGQPPG